MAQVRFVSFDIQPRSYAPGSNFDITYRYEVTLDIQEVQDAINQHIKGMLAQQEFCNPQSITIDYTTGQVTITTGSGATTQTVEGRAMVDIKGQDDWDPDDTQQERQNSHGVPCVPGTHEYDNLRPFQVTRAILNEDDYVSDQIYLNLTVTFPGMGPLTARSTTVVGTW